MKYLDLEINGSISVEELLKTQSPEKESEGESHAHDLSGSEHISE